MALNAIATLTLLCSLLVSAASSGIPWHGDFYGGNVTGHGAVSALDPAKTGCLVLGDSKALLLGAQLPNFPWFNKLAWISNLAASGSSILGSSNVWGTNGCALSARLVNGTNGVLVYWSGHNDTAGDGAANIVILSNLFAQVVASNWQILALTTQPIVSNDTSTEWLFLAQVNNWLRWKAPLWRMVDTMALYPNCYDTTMYCDGVHPTDGAFTNIIGAMVSEVYAAKRAFYPQQWAFQVGTNWAWVYPGATNGAATLAPLSTR